MDLQVEFAPGVPLRRQLGRQLRDATRSGRLGAGSALPPSRLLAEELGVSRGVVVDCYSQLTTEGYLIARTGSGTRVAYAPVPPHESAPEPQAASAVTKIRFDLRPGQADFHAFPRRQWQAALTRTLRELPDRRLTSRESSARHCASAGSPPSERRNEALPRRRSCSSKDNRLRMRVVEASEEGPAGQLICG
jgi:DNA-binding transcriptional MocR family regulator